MAIDLWKHASTRATAKSASAGVDDQPTILLTHPSQHLFRSTNACSHARNVSRKSAVVVKAAVEPKKVLMMGGTRFIGQYLARQLVEQGHEVTLYTRGKSPVTSQIPDDTPESFAKYQSGIKHIAGDRKDFEDVKAKLSGQGFQVVYDINGREASEAMPIVEACKGSLEQ
eukprot:gene13671-19559_t